jgi:hypothetical protein
MQYGKSQEAIDRLLIESAFNFPKGNFQCHIFATMIAGRFQHGHAVSSRISVRPAIA